MKFLTKINEYIALRITLATSTMWCVYLFAAISLAPLFDARLEPFCMYVSTTFLQLVLLPLIMVGQNLLGRDQERRSKEDHLALRTLMEEMQVLIRLRDQEIAELHDFRQNLVLVSASADKTT